MRERRKGAHSRRSGSGRERSDSDQAARRSTTGTSCSDHSAERGYGRGRDGAAADGSVGPAVTGGPGLSVGVAVAVPLGVGVGRALDVSDADGDGLGDADCVARAVHV